MDETEPTKRPRVDHEGSNTKLQNLPDNLIHYIMHLLHCKDAIKISVLSKDFYSHWLSFPVLDFNYDFFRLKNNPDETFFTYIRRITELRGPHIKDYLHKLSFSYHEEIKFAYPYQYRTAFDALLGFAVQNNCKEIIFDVQISVPFRFVVKDLSTIDKTVSYGKLFPLFFSKFLTVLKLTGLKFNPVADAFISCPNLEELLINSCEGFDTIAISAPSLKKVEVKCCNRLRAFHVEGGIRLESFIFEGVRKYDSTLQPCEVDLPVCDSLRYLHLTKVKVLADNLNEVVTEFLYLSGCDLPESLQIHNPHVKVLEMDNNYNTENLVLHTPDLESFKFKGSDRAPCRLNISACLALKILKLIEVTTIGDQWLKDIISLLVFLKEVELVNCNMLQRMEFRAENLEKFTLYGCPDLREAAIDAPNLLQFNYLGHLRISLLILSSKCSGNVRLVRNITDHASWFERIVEFLRCFDHFKELTLSCSTAEDIIFPRELVWANKVSPLYDVKHIRFQAGDIQSNEVVTQLVESLLWLVPKPLTLQLSSLSRGMTGILKFGYGSKVEARKVEQCCSTLPIKCWKHFMLRVDYEGFDDDDDMKKCLEKFFAPYHGAN